jgi:hypothetical protein
MYDEYERALTGKTGPRGLSPLGWLGVSVGMLMLVGAVGVGYGMIRVASRVRHVAHELRASSGADIARMVSRLDRSARLVALDPDAGLAFLQGLAPGDPSQALVQNVVGRQLDLPDAIQAVSGAAHHDEASSTTIHSGDGDVRVDLTRGKNGGSLVVNSKDGHVRFDLVKSSTGGTLTIDSDDGRTRIDLIRGAGGGQLVIHGDDGTVELGVGSSSRGAPGWVLRPEGMPDSGRPLFSVTTPDAALGAVAWEDDATPGERVASFRKALEDAGYEVEAEHSRSGPDGEEASLWARRDKDGRTVFLLSRRLDGQTHEVLGYGKGDATGR